MSSEPGAGSVDREAVAQASDFIDRLARMEWTRGRPNVCLEDWQDEAIALSAKLVALTPAQPTDARAAADEQPASEVVRLRGAALEEAARIVDRQIPAPAGGPLSHTNSMRVVLIDAAAAIRKAALAATPPASPDAAPLDRRDGEMAATPAVNQGR
ncbi:hypothetical protein [Sphingomonas sp.]|uniref:hypothetical protein n=1 Tax=Sphingomonas sp. TaxID=28214 RepID=UPI003AFFDB86